ncbi:cytochrome c oxidase accessory protein CcoG [soil metagenome]
MNEDGSRHWIRPKPSHGAWWRRRRTLAYALMAVFFLVPHLHFAGKPLFLMDLPRRQFTLVGYTFLPTDTLLFMFLLGSLIFGIFLLTAFFGRAWCGWACPQTVFLEFLFRPVGRWFDGGYTGARHADKAGEWFTPWRIGKYAAFLVMSLFVSHTFLAFFVGPTTLYHWVLSPPSEHPTAFLFIVLFTGVVWFNFTYFREQTCLIVCPYGRWQAALIDSQSLIVAYDYNRGEPRALGMKDRDPAAGDCISCNACVQTCPTGIDIRNGLQMECVHCTQCIDACDDVMRRVDKPVGLIRYSSQDAMAGKARRLVRLRTVLYPLVLVILVGGLVTTLAMKAPADVTILRGLGGPFAEEADGRISNQVRIKVTNRGSHDELYTLSVEQLSGGGLDSAKDVVIVAPENPLPVKAGATQATSMFIVLPRRAFVNGERAVRIVVTDTKRYADRESWRLLGPSAGNRP